MNRWRLIFAGIALGTLCACAAQQGVTTTPDTTPTVKKTPSIQGTDLPCAEINRTDSMVIRYLSENIYRNGAVLPKQEGLDYKIQYLFQQLNYLWLRYCIRVRF